MQPDCREQIAHVMRPLPGEKLVGTRIAGDKREIGHGIFLSVLTDPCYGPLGPGVPAMAQSNISGSKVGQYRFFGSSIEARYRLPT
jgi:hypothetical protein